MKHLLHYLLTVLFVFAVPQLSMADTWDGSAVEWTNGSGTAADPYLIESAANLAWLQEMVNGGVSTYSGQSFKLTTDINLGSISWLGIGTSETVSFQGTFDGDNHRITGINSTSALFNYVKNFTLKKLSTAGSAAISGIIQNSYGTTRVENCHSAVAATNYGISGGIVGKNYGTCTITNCSNTGNVTGTTAGGIVGCTINSDNCTITNCSNSGKISGGNKTNRSGGIVGEAIGIATISDCHNTGEVTHTTNISTREPTSIEDGYAYAGGIVGYTSNTCTVARCYNTGSISARATMQASYSLNSSSYIYFKTFALAGGIIGHCESMYSCNVSLCYNSGGCSASANTDGDNTNPNWGGPYTYSYAYSGGIVGNSNVNGYVSNCYNRADITSTANAFSNNLSSRSTKESYSAGISYGSSIININCYNTGTLSATNGKYGISNGTATNCYYLSTCGGSGNGTSKTETIMKSNSMPILLDSTVFTVDRVPYFNDGYPIFRSSRYMVTTDATNVGFRTTTLNGAYYLYGVEADVQGFFYKKASDPSYDTVYANIGSPFESNLTDLTPGTTFTYQAFVTKRSTTYYGEQKTFSTLSCTSLTAAIAASATSICAGDTATLTASGASDYSENFYYSWNNGATTAEIRPTEAGTYTVTVTDDNGCTATKSTTLTVNPLPVGTISGRTSICSGNSTTLTASGANSYTWSTGATTPTLTTSTAGTYTCTFRNTYGCTSTQDVTISVFTAPTITGISAICSGNSTTLTASGADNYTWSTGATTSSITVSEGGTYTVTGTISDGCEGSAGVTVSVGSLPTINISGNPSFCQGSNTVLTATGGISYEWANGTTDNTITVTTPGIDVVTGTNADGCSNTASIEVAMRPSYINMPVSAAICQGSTYNAMGTSYSTAGAYHVEGTTAAGCDSIIDLTLTVNPLPTPSITGNTSICQGTSTTLAALGGTSFLWNNGSTSQAINVNQSGVYSVTVTDANGCSNSTSATVSVNPLPTVTIAGNTAICAGNSTTLTASGADSYLWNNGSNGQSLTVSNAGTYTVTGTNAYGCQNTASATISVNPSYNNVTASQAICEGATYNFFGTMLNEAGTYNHSGTTTAGCDSVVNLTLTVNPLPTATINGNTTFCEGNNTTLTATGGATYLWNDGTTTSSITVANGGAYSVTATDANGCNNTASAVVTANPLPNITISGNTAFCEGSTTTLTAQGGNSYTWNNGAQTAYITVTSSGNYTVTGVGSNGCYNTASVSVSATPLPTITINGNTSFCQGGSTTLTATGADSYTWNNGTTTPSITVDAFGIYSVVGSTAIGCTGTASVTVTVSPNPTITISGDTELCPDETTTLTANGGTSYMWFDGTTSATYQTSTAGSYSVIGYNDAGCHTMATAEVEAYPDAESEETATATGSYTWNGETYTESGDYTFVTTTAHGCDSTVTLHLTIEEGGNDGIDDISADDIKVYVNGRNIVIEGSLDESVMVYDVMGRIIYHDVVRAPITAPAAGVYMVKIGNAKARKVVILR